MVGVMGRAGVIVVVLAAALAGGAVVLAAPELLQQAQQDASATGETAGREQRLSPPDGGAHERPPSQGVEDDEEDEALDTRTARWAGAAYDFLQAMSCRAPAWTTEEACLDAQRIPRRSMRVWAARAGRRYVARLPDGALQRSGVHDGVLLLDPFPAASWGHLALVLFVAANTTRGLCGDKNGFWLEPGDCLTVALKERCQNLLDRRGRRRNYSRRCEINFPPLVVTEEDARTPFRLHAFTHAHGHGPIRSEALRQRLRCRSDAQGYAPCPRLRPLNDTEHLVCDPLGVNSKRCSPTHETVHTRCRLFEVCDQAVVLSGGWSRDLSPEVTRDNVKLAYNMLRHNGFHKGNIKIFYANGAKKDADPDLRHAIYPSSMKLGARYHLRSLCASPLCTDSLVLYLAGPTLNDGTLLLWDQDRNGLLRGGEVYTPRELLRDLENCAARQVTVLVDASYAGEIVKAFAHSKKHKNVQVYAAGGSDDYSWGTEFTRHWTHYSHTHSCTRQVHETSLSAVHLSTPASFDGSGGELRKTIFGAPCDVSPPFSWRELHHSYFGCQNTPTAIWLRSGASNFSPPDLRDITDEFFPPQMGETSASEQ